MTRCVTSGALNTRNTQNNITPFVGKQIDIAKAFGFEIPNGCDAKYKSKKSREKKIGRPAKAKVVHEPKG